MSHSLPQHNEDCKYVEIVIKSDKNNSSFHNYHLEDSYSIEQRECEEEYPSSPSSRKDPAAAAAAVTLEASSCAWGNLMGLRCSGHSIHVSRLVLLRCVVALFLSGNVL